MNAYKLGYGAAVAVFFVWELFKRLAPLIILAWIAARILRAVL